MLIYVVADYGHGLCDEESRVRDNHIDLVRGALCSCEAVLDSGSFDWRPVWVEYCYLVEGFCGQGSMSLALSSIIY